MDTGTRNIIIIIASFIAGIIFSLTIVLVAFWSYKMGQSDINSEKISHQSFKEDFPTQNIVIVTPTMTPVQIVNVTIPTAVPQYVFPTAVSISNQNSSGNVDSEARQKVMNYMYGVNNILMKSKMWDSPDAFAQQLLSSTMAGDTSGFDSLISNYEQSKNSLMSLSVPRECSEYHNSAINLIDSGIGLLKELKSSIKSQNMEGLLGIQSKASLIEEEAKRVDSLAKDLYKLYNIPEPK